MTDNTIIKLLEYYNKTNVSVYNIALSKLSIFNNVI